MVSKVKIKAQETLVFINNFYFFMVDIFTYLTFFAGNAICNLLHYLKHFTLLRV